MSNFIYELLAVVGYTHPLHPVVVHAPAGKMIGALCFAIWSQITHKPVYRQMAHQIIILSAIFTVFAIAFGVMDWQRFYGGAWIFEIKVKLILAGLYSILVLLMAWLGQRNAQSKTMLLLYVSGFLTVSGLGYFGGQLVYHGFTPDAPEQFASGQHIFESHCSGCHRRGENIIVPTLPLRNAPQLKNPIHFRDFVRNPHMPDGSPGLMPSFSPHQINDEQMQHLYDYLDFTFSTPNRDIANR